MKDVRYTENFGGFDYGSREKSIALGVVGIITSGGSIEGVTVKIRRVLNKVIANAGRRARSDYGTEPVFVIVRNSDAANHGLGIGEFGLAITRDINADLVSECGESAREGANNIGESPCLGIRDTLGCGEGDMHWGRASRARTDALTL
jgi:hypothetical protein